MTDGLKHVLALLIAFVFLLSCDSSPTEPKNNITLTVLVNENDGPVPGAEISVQSIEQTWKTDETGTVVIKGLADKRYLITAEHPNGLKLTRGLYVADDSILDFIFSYGSIRISVLDSNGDFVPGALVKGSPSIGEKMTDGSEALLFETVFAKEYEISVVYANHEVFSKRITVTPDSLSDLSCMIYGDYSMKLTNESGSVLEGAYITTDPPTETVKTDYSGYAALTNILTGKYELTIRKNDVTVLIASIEITHGTMETVALTYSDKPPEIVIKSPQQNEYVITPFLLNGYANDLEDGMITGDELVWKSDIDGLLGTGSIVACNRISLGWHLITLEVTDSNGYKTSDSIRVNVVQEKPDNSFFPIIVYSQWRYRYDERVFAAPNADGVMVEWDLGGVDVSVLGDASRNARMEYTSETDGRKKYYTYDIRDYLINNNGNIYIEKTVESLEVLDSYVKKYYVITTEYSEPYLLLENHADLQPGAFFTNDLVVTMNWKGTIYYEEFTERYSIHSETSVGEEETVETPLGDMNALPVTIESEGSYRKWWLKHGVGIVKMEHNMFSPHPVAILYGSSLLRSRKTAQAKSAGDTGPVYLNVPDEISNGSDPVPRDIRTLVNLSRQLIPR